MISQLLVNPTSSESYNIIIDFSLDISHIISHIENKQVLVVTNTTVAGLYLDGFLESIPDRLDIKVCVLEDGEQYKSQASLDKILSSLLENQYTRNSTVLVALGGGVIGDITGFAAAIYQRGVDFIQVPTTLLSQVDSSVGGKTAINHPLGKNMIGAFYQPKLVYTSVQFYQTLPQREYTSGMAEVVKYAFISKDFYYWLDLNRDKILAKDASTLIDMVKKSCQIKAQVVAEDEKETTGARAIVNFGHTFCHAIEKCQKYLGLKHGEAVGVGMAQAIDFSCYLGMISEQQAKDFKEFIISFNISIDFPRDICQKEFLDVMLLDKKNSNKELKFILIKDIGDLALQKQSKRDLELFLTVSNRK
ncbi:3-dehydroquinate synthase [Francisella orientalis]|uniref:3-dehydroquinate synthase n=1 Tax=Francisella orientalis TaxID=299583 RepID=A0AAP7C6K4_9GAMM|nr:3-dehydroquinate synthase [Francisella orientalis]AFJ44083.1 3-dehydroquinate synthase [Francisella orientalis str. Toba 04]AHB98522.1 3-dehydroquinate synthase [Francisella orientalis LADL 07-285A]AKN85749.1 3-dehydroquinate synthase [Francisella orientalis FNO12]AKN87288.1 3-dehydroquinate synthase [Francisella orientalis FNO24]AKN88826.1 3-dehydroquinate synthase [Francisella orientalis]